MPKRSYSSASGYRYGFNGQENSNEIAGLGNHTTAEFWEYDARLGRRWNVDPVYKHSPYEAFGGNPISFADPIGADTVDITRTTTRHKFPDMKSGLDNDPIRKMDAVNSHVGINIIEAKGNDVFRITDVTITLDENGNETSTSKTTTLELNNKQTLYRNGGHNMKGYQDDRYALAANSPKWLLQYYANKSNDLGVRSTLIAQKDVAFVAGVEKVANVAYTLTGAYGLFRFTFSRFAFESAVSGGSKFFDGASYSSKVLKQMSKADDLFHGFPASVDAYATKFGQWSTKIGADGKPYQWLKMPGSYGGKTGVFEYIKDAKGVINHRFLNTSRVP